MSAKFVSANIVNILTLYINRYIKKRPPSVLKFFLRDNGRKVNVLPDLGRKSAKKCS